MFSQDWQKKPFWRSDKGTFECLKYYSSLLLISQNRIIKSKNTWVSSSRGPKYSVARAAKASPQYHCILNYASTVDNKELLTSS